MQKPEKPGKRPANSPPQQPEKGRHRPQNRRRKRHHQPPQRKAIGKKARRQPQKQIKAELTAGQRQIKQKGHDRRRGKKEHILKKHRPAAAGQHHPDHAEHIVIRAEQKAAAAA